MKKGKLFLTAGLSLFAFQIFADVKPATVISDGMVFQADMPMRVWGLADPGERVKLSFMGKNAQTIADKDGKWHAELPKSSYIREGQTLTIQGKNKIEIRDVLVGEVWLLSGQSNMDFALVNTKGGRELMNEPANLQIRYFDIKEVPCMEPIGAADVDREKLRWRISDAKSRERMSSVGVPFGNRIFRELNVPIGLINASIGGSELQAWLTWEWGRASGEEQWLEGADRRVINWREKDMKKWEELPDAERAKKRKPNLAENRVSSCYNAKINMIVPYAVRGELWYQGEGNAGAPKPYYKLFIKYAEMMRAIFKNPDMPIYTVQLPDYTNKEWPAFRDIQRRIALAVPNSGIAVTIDGHEMELHPADKSNVIKRLSEMVLADVYGKKYDAHSPIAPKAKLSGSVVKIKFDNAYKGLKTLDAKAPRTFELSEDGKNFVSAEAKITGKDEVSLKLPDGIAAPAFVRYAWAPDPDVNLVNSSDLPVSPFDTDIVP